MWFPIKTKKERERKGKGHREWQQHDIRNIIWNDLLIGRVVYATYRDAQYKRGKREPSRHLRDRPPLTTYRPELRVVDDATFERNNRILNERGNTPSRITTSFYAFSGVLKCPHCGASLVSHGGKSHRYICRTYQASGKSACPGFIVHELAARDAIIPLVARLLAEHIGGAIAEASRESSDDGVVSQLKAEIAALDHEVENLIRFAREGAITADQLRDQNFRLLAARRDKVSRLESLERKDKGTRDTELFTDEFMANLPDFIMFLYEHKKKVFSQVARLMFAGIKLNSTRQGKGVWKRGMKMIHGRHTPRPCTIEQVIYDDRFAEWIGADTAGNSTASNEKSLACRSRPNRKTISSRRW